MEIRITVPDEGTGDLRSLYEWLRSEDSLRGRTRLMLAPFDDEEMGAAQDTIAVAAGSGGALTVLASALPVWLRQRGTTRVKVEVSEATRGLRLSVEADRADDAERVLRQALDAVTIGARDV